MKIINSQMKWVEFNVSKYLSFIYLLNIIIVQWLFVYVLNWDIHVQSQYVSSYSWFKVTILLGYEMMKKKKKWEDFVL